MVWVISIFLFVIIFGLLINSAESNSSNKRLNNFNKFISDNNFICSTKIQGYNNTYIFSVDEVNRKILVGLKIINWDDIVSVELIENNNLIYQKSAIRTIGGALIGGAISGGVGAIIGGFSGKTKQDTLIESIKVKIIIQNIQNPSIIIYCFDKSAHTFDRKPIKKSSIIYRDCMDHAEKIKDTISVIINITDRGISNESINYNLLSNNYDSELINIIKTGNILLAAKYYKEQNGCSFSEAKDYIDQLKSKITHY
jgi:hypothetical protein